MAGIKAQIGLPNGLAPPAIPDIVTLGADTSSVTFTLMCSELTIVELDPGGYGGAHWQNISQPDGNPWLFTSKVDLRMFATDQSAYSKLPPAVQKQIANLGAAAFSVQQLLFDLDNAALETTPTIAGAGKVAQYLLTTYFINLYFKAMQAKGAPLLGCAVSQPSNDPSTLKLSNINLEVCPLLGGGGTPYPNPTPAQQQLATLNYLCETDNDPPSPPRTFTWNWVEPGDQFDGVVAINRNIFAKYFRGKLDPAVSANCFEPWTRVWLSGAFKQNLHYAYSMTPNQTPTVTTPATGSTVLQYHWSGYHEDDAGLNGDMGHLTISTTMDCSVQFTGNQIIITQHLVVYLYVKKLATPGGGNVVDKTITDTYTVNIDPQGRLVVASPPSTSHVDNSQDPSTNSFLNFWADAQDIINKVKDWIRSFVPTNFTDVPVSFVQDFVFPGGNSFVFRDIQFSNNQDLTGRITYADPNQVHLAAVNTTPNVTVPVH